MGEPLPNSVAYTHHWQGSKSFKEDASLMVLLPTRHVVFDTDAPDKLFASREIMERERFQISYSFPRRRRVNTAGISASPDTRVKAYGINGITFRQLYDFLCEQYNGGERFVDAYFSRVFPESPVGREFKLFEEDTRKELRDEYDARRKAAFERRRTKSGRADLRTREGVRLKDFGVWKKRVLLDRLDRFSGEIRREIIACLANGRIPLNHLNHYVTMSRRMKLGLDSRHVFYASGQLINSIEVDIRMPEDSFAAV
jgi:hypothetical protein